MLVAKSLWEMEFGGDAYHGHCQFLVYAQLYYSHSSSNNHLAYHDIYIILLPSIST